MPVEPDDLRVVMRRWAAGVTVVTAEHNGTLSGMTVTSFTSVSLDQPQVLVCIEKGTRTHHAIVQSGRFAVSLLEAGQQRLSMRFGGQIDEEADRFAGVATWTSVSGSPIIEGAIAYLDCRVTGTLETKTHTVFVGMVEASGVSDGADRPLLYYNQDYRRLADDDGDSG